MSQTPRTDSVITHFDLEEYCLADEMRKLERELNAANEIAKKYEDRYYSTLDRIKILERAGDALSERCEVNIENWYKAKEGRR